MKDFKASNFKGLLFLLPPAAILAVGIFLSMDAPWSLIYFTGQFIMGIFLFQCFILLHETGHLNYFKNRGLNKFFGHLFGFISFIPFTSWMAIHNLHHKWTGYRDKDPTTEGTVNPKFGRFTKLLVNICWALWLPLFTIGYRLGNYWNIGKLKKHLLPKQLPNIYLNMAIQVSLYIVLFYFFGGWMIRYVGIAYLFSLAISDIFILSQHSHIEIPIAGDKVVDPLRFSDQIPYTRSVALQKMFARYIYFNFNMHELHHAHPGLPAYYLDKINHPTPNNVPFFNYLKDAKMMSGMSFIFSSSKKQIGKINHTNSK